MLSYLHKNTSGRVAVYCDRRFGHNKLHPSPYLKGLTALMPW